MPNPTRHQSLQAVRIRASKLNDSGAPLTGASNGYVSDAIVDCTVKVVTEAGENQTQKNGAGVVCATYVTCDTIKQLTLDLNFCQLDAWIINFLTAADLFMSGGNPVGWEYPAVSAACPNGICIEIWSRAWDSSVAATPAVLGGSAAYFHWVFPNCTFTMGDVKMDSNIMVVPINGISQENPHITADGPFNDWPAYVAAAGGVTRVGGVFYDAAIASVTGSPVTVTSADS